MFNAKYTWTREDAEGDETCFVVDIEFDVEKADRSVGIMYDYVCDIGATQVCEDLGRLPTGGRKCGEPNAELLKEFEQKLDDQHGKLYKSVIEYIQNIPCQDEPDDRDDY